jgi:hypothetical protein
MEVVISLIIAQADFRCKSSGGTGGSFGLLLTKQNSPFVQPGFSPISTNPIANQ